MTTFRSFRLFALSQATFYGSLFICIMLKPKSLSANGGISYFGNFAQTILPYAAGLILAVGLGVAAASLLRPGQPADTVRVGLYGFALGVLGILITPSLSTPWVSLTHEWIGSILFFLQLVLCTWLVFYIMPDRMNISLLFIQLISGLAAGFYLHPPTGLLMQSQVIFEVMFGLILLRSWNTIEVITANVATS